MEFDPAVDGMKPPGMAHNVYSSLVTPRPIGWISTISAAGVVNLAPFSFFNMVAGDPPTVIYCPGGSHVDGGPKDSLRNVMEVPEFVFNLCTVDLLEVMNATSANLPSGVDEMKEAGIEAAPSTKVRPPRVAASPINLECEVVEIVDLPPAADHKNTMVIGKAVQIRISDDVIVDGMVHWQRLRPLGRLGYFDYAGLGEVITLPRPA
jgi:flavin reductase (DIM6/NTAB) family NADH-FMN oxidoreductase RutF